MRSNSIIFPAILALIISSCQINEMKEAEENTIEISRDELINRGEYLVNLMTCHDCHTPKKMVDGERVLNLDSLLCGHPQGMGVPNNLSAVSNGNGTMANANNSAFAGEWGVSFAANITPDTQTGIGNWTLEQFAMVMREGKHIEGDSSRNILPPMPWQRYKKLYDNDMLAIYTYLKSLKPIKNSVPDNIPPG